MRAPAQYPLSGPARGSRRSSELIDCFTVLAGNSDSTRKAAGKQIVDVARAHPPQLVSITRKVRGGALSTDRAAAAVAEPPAGSTQTMERVCKGSAARRSRPQVHVYLYSKKWETRTAAADTLGALGDAFPHHTPADLAAAATAAAAAGGGAESLAAGVGAAEGGKGGIAWQVSLWFDGVDLQRVVDRGQPLLASGGQVRGGCGQTDGRFP